MVKERIHANSTSRQDHHEMYLSAITVLELQRGIVQSEKRGDKPQAAMLTR